MVQEEEVVGWDMEKVERISWTRTEDVEEVVVVEEEVVAAVAVVVEGRGGGGGGVERAWGRSNANEDVGGVCKLEEDLVFFEKRESKGGWCW